MRITTDNLSHIVDSSVNFRNSILSFKFSPGTPLFAYLSSCACPYAFPYGVNFSLYVSFFAPLDNPLLSITFPLVGCADNEQRQRCGSCVPTATHPVIRKPSGPVAIWYICKNKRGMEHEEI